MLLWPFNEADFFSELFPRCVALRKPVPELLQTVLLTPRLGFCSDVHYQLFDTFIKTCVSFPNQTYSIEFATGYRTQSLVTPTSNMNAPELNSNCPR